MPRARLLLAVALLSAGLAAPAFAQTAGEPTRAPKATTGAAGHATTTAPAARTKGWRGAAVTGKGTAGVGSSGPDAASGAAAPGGPGSPPPTLPVPTPGSGATPAAPAGPGFITGAAFDAPSLLKV